MGAEERFAAIRKGLLEYLILKIVAADKVYAADILKRLSAADFATQEGTLYPLLSKMRRDGLLEYEWRESDAGPPRKYYELTAQGQSQLRELNDYWAGLNETIAHLGK
jgi:PadR family transcriptional regulator PadR